MNPTLKKIIPGALRQKVVTSVSESLKQTRIQESDRIPKYRLEPKHLSSLKAVPTREDMLDLLPSDAVVAELGVFKGDFSESILKRTNPKKFHLVDMWGSDRYHQGFRKQVEDKFAKEIEAGQVEINLGLSTEVVNQFEDAYFDWIYIDTDHGYDVTIAELNAYKSKVKPGGIMSGHDYAIGSWDNMVRYGVIEAVHEFCVKNDWEMLYLSMETDIHPSFAIREIIK